MAVETLELAPAYRISRLLRGGWQLAGGHGPVDEERAIADMAAFVDAGVTTFDCADIYTGVEDMIGRYLTVELTGTTGSTTPSTTTGTMDSTTTDSTTDSTMDTTTGSTTDPATTTCAAWIRGR